MKWFDMYVFEKSKGVCLNTVDFRSQITENTGHQTRVVSRLAIVYDAGPTLKQHWAVPGISW